MVFGKGAEFAEKYLHKGTKVVVTGRLETGSYTKDDGTKVYTTTVVVEPLRKRRKRSHYNHEDAMVYCMDCGRNYEFEYLEDGIYICFDEEEDDEGSI